MIGTGNHYYQSKPFEHIHPSWFGIVWDKLSDIEKQITRAVSEKVESNLFIASNLRLKHTSHTYDLKMYFCVCGKAKFHCGETNGTEICI